MNVAPDAPKRLALRYYGGKWQLASWIISHFPDHESYVEPCGGAASVLLQKPRSPLETYNDLDGNVVNFFRVLRDRPGELIEKIQLTPWARDEYELARVPCDEPTERARRFYCLCQMGISASAKTSSGMRMVYEVTGGIPAKIGATVGHLYEIAGRLLGVQIENRDALELIRSADRPDTLFYLDPPYLSETRSHKNEYLVEQGDEDFHIRAASLLHDIRGYVVVSGYACPLYTELYEAHNWPRFDKRAQTNSGGIRTESIWLSPRTVEALAIMQQLPLFE